MSPEDQAEIAATIGRAFGLAQQGQLEASVWCFATARSLAVSLADPEQLDQQIDNHDRPLIRERERYRQLIAQQRQSEDRILVFGDSLGMPRPDSKHGEYGGADSTYPFMLLAQRPGWAVDSICQRYFTMRRVLDMLLAEPDLATGADVILHIGLNDCADRMFLENERLALDLLPTETKAQMVRFAQEHRRAILSFLPGHHYVPPPQFTACLDSILTLLAGRARRVVVATVILPPIRFWAATPGLQANFGRYNLALMEAAARHGAHVFDVDRHMWANQQAGVLLPDGMHLSTPGHELFAKEAAALLAS